MKLRVFIFLQTKMSRVGLISAARNGDLHRVNELIAQNEPVNRQIPYTRETALMWAARMGHLGIVESLIKSGAFLDMQDKSGSTALTRAAANGHLKVVESLVKSGANVNQQSNFGGSALMHAAKNNHVNVVRTLLRAGANINLENKQGKTVFELSDNDAIKNLITEYKIIRDSIKLLKILRLGPMTVNSDPTYFFVIPKDLIFLIETRLRDEDF